MPPNSTWASNLVLDGGSLTAEQIHSVILDGTAPLTVVSTTVVSNLNADLLDGEEASAFQDAHANLTSLAALAGTVGLVKQTSAGVFGIDESVYLTAEADTLDDVTGRGATTTNAISTGDATMVSATIGPLAAGQYPVEVKDLLGNVVVQIGSYGASGNSNKLGRIVLKDQHYGAGDVILQNGAGYLDIVQGHASYGFLTHKGGEWGGQGVKSTGEFMISTSGTTKPIWFFGNNFGSGSPTRAEAALAILNMDVYLPADNNKLYFGTGDDAAIYYNGTDLIIDPAVVGSGVVNLNGGGLLTTGTLAGKLVAETAASDPQGGSPPAGVLGQICYYSGKLYFCTATTPTWEMITSA